MTTSLVTGPTLEPLTWAQVADHLRIQSVDEDMDTSSIEYLDRLIKATRTHLELSYLNRAFITQTWKYYLDSFPACNYIELPYPPLQSITHVKYTNTAGTVTTLTLTTDYLVDTVSTPGRVVLPYSGSWPSSELYPINPVEIQFVCGYGATADYVPDEIKQGMLLLISDLYENRESQVERALVENKTVERLLSNYRIFVF